MPLSPWISTLRDRTDNRLVISGYRGFVAENPVGYQTDPGWFSDVLTTPNVARLADYRAFQVSGGDPIINAIGCCIVHARNGENDTQSWNHATTGTANDGSPVCRVTVTGVADFAVGAGASHNSNTGTGIGGAFALAQTKAGADAVWVGAIRPNLTETGVLDYPDPVVDGYPADSTLIWEDGGLELTKVELTVDDDFTPPAASTDYVVAAINAGLRPAWISGTWDAWPLGVPPGASGVEYMADGVTLKDHPVLVEDPSLPWVEYVGLDDWAKCFDKTAGQEPDIIASRFTDAAYNGWSGVLSGSSGVRIAIRVTLRSPRYRWEYEGTVPTTVVRQFPRDDSQGLSSAPRLWPPSKNHRLAGGYPGGSNA